MRSIWVHGSYFQALDKDLLLGALELQDELLGPTIDFSPRQGPGNLDLPTEATPYLTPKQRDSLHVVNGLTNQSWFFHSPLQYWSCSSDLIDRDHDLLATVNERKTQPTSVNVTLRHSIVFSGKRFEDRHLVAADALVITLIHRRDSPVGHLWQEKVQALADSTDKWRVITPQDGRLSQLYEFQFRLLSKVDAILLGCAYSLVLLYFLFSLSKLRAVKSKVGLMVTVVVQLALAIISSFTICAIFKIDLSRIPQFGYPVVIFSMSLENIFRLINAVILTPSEDCTSNRIGHAFGQTAPIALASVAQNLLILYGLSRVVSDGVSAFCTFAAIAIVFDFFYLSTFFLTVLSVDVRRTELSDALAKASIRTHRPSDETPPRQPWLDTVLQGKIALSTRVAGTVVMIGFVLIAQWHFFENESVARTLRRLVRMSGKNHDEHPSRSSLLVEVHQARSPTSWLQLQDHETAREVINIIKPAAYSYTAKVFDPYIFVLKGSDRMLSAHEPLLSPAIYDFARHQMTPFLVTILVAAALVRLLMNFLLWDQSTDNEDARSSQPSLLSIKTLHGGHHLDVALLTASSSGHLVSVGLDRVVRVWNIKEGGYNYVLGEQKNSPRIPFPILAICIEDEFHWLALLTVDRVLLWNLVDHCWGPLIKVEPYRHKPEVFFFGNDDCSNIPPLIMVRRDGIVTELRPEFGEASSYAIPEDSVVTSVDALAEKAFPPKIMTSTREGQIHLITQDGFDWVSSAINVGPHQSIKEREFISIQALPDISFFLIIRSQTVDLVDSHTHRAIYTFRVDPILPKSLKAFHSRPRKMRCGSAALWSFSIAYTNAYTRDLVVQTYSPQNEEESLCFCDPDSPSRSTCCPWRRAKETRRIIKNPGVWLALPSGIMVGVRKKTPNKHHTHSNNYSQPASQSTGLRRRHHHIHHHHNADASQHPPHDDWEVWMFSHFGGKQDTWETAPLCLDAEDDGHLFVTSLGPMANVGSSSVVVGLSNVIKVITVGQERFETEDVVGPGSGVPAVSSRRRKGPSSVRTRPAMPPRKCC
ncbi:sterol-sensing domain of SREBP cleavage-activation-domain-containing protein [Astrocystis sublimbata]|nr:sterol-sensing domain of SREBP cleavage-activation-domain-containing protein [Astrocystis sublimbata]